MLNRQFDPNRHYRAVEYLRMSDPGQNARSPDQQHDMIVQTLERAGYSWRIVKSYRDSGKTGRLTRNRDDYQQMLRELRSGEVAADLVLVDTIERFGRVDDLDSIRRRLYENHGILVLAADRHFSDPTSPEGRALSLLENHRASEDSRIKAHQVFRGKVDKAKQGFWPGGPNPFGTMLDCVSTERRKGRIVHHNRLVPDPEAAAVIQLLFRHAADNPNLGQARLAEFLSSHPAVPPKFKPFHADTVGSWLRHTTYIGKLTWAVNSTGIVADRRVVERNADEDVIVIPDFCEPIISRELWERVQVNLRLRSRQIAKTKDDDGRILLPMSRGTIYKYLLSGLVRCESCNASMIANSSSPYVTKAGESRQYTGYMCPNRRTGACDNGIRVPERWLRENVVSTLIARLFPPKKQSVWLPELSELVREELALRSAAVSDERPALNRERDDLERQIEGWTSALGDPELHPDFLSRIKVQVNVAYGRIEDIDTLLRQYETRESLADDLIDQYAVKRRLDRLAQVLDAECPTMGNLHLSMHIDRISCDTNGRITMRSCKLGTVFGAVELLAANVPKLPNEPGNVSRSPERTNPRRRGRVRLDIESEENSELMEAAEWATDPHRFAGLPDKWFWLDEFTIPEKSCWSKDNAYRVLSRFREVERETGKKPALNALAREFGKSRPTITRALERACEDSNDEPAVKRRKTPLRVKGVPEVENEIVRLHQSGLEMKAIGRRIGINRNTVARVLDEWYAQQGKQRPDERKRRRKK